jgi:SAM-dependent methyltransferase
MSNKSAESIDFFINKLKTAIADSSFLKMTLSRPVEQAESLKNLFLRPVLLKNGLKIQVNHRFASRDEVKNWTPDETFLFLKNQLGDGWLNADLMLSDEEISFQTDKKGVSNIFSKIKKDAAPAAKPLAHDHAKNRLLDPKSAWLVPLGIANQQGEILKNAQDKWRQINKFLEIIESLLKTQKVVAGNTFRVADMGSGKGYLTFALFDFLKNTLDLDAQVVGIELRPALVDFCNKIAQSVDFQGLTFVAQNINDWQPADLDLLIALHACDTATDLAIASGVRVKAKMIVVAPCCHKQIRREMAAEKAFEPMLKHGILLERQAEILTDSIRALLLESKGYRTQVFEFISSEHTAKNLMITAVKGRANAGALAEIAVLKAAFGVKTHFLETII